MVFIVYDTVISICVRPEFLVAQALAAMVKLELPHINLLTKVDLAEDKQAMQEFLIPDKHQLLSR